MAGVTFLAPDTDAYVASVERHADEFRERTGIPLRIEIVDSDSYFSNAIQDRLEAGSADVFMSGPVVRALRDAYTGVSGVAEALELAAADIDELTSGH